MISVVGTSVTSSGGATLVCVSVTGLGVNADAWMLIGGRYYRPTSIRNFNGVTTFCFKLSADVHGPGLVIFGDDRADDDVAVDV